MAADVRIETTLRFVREHVGRPDLSARLIAHHVAISRSVLYRLFKDHGGVACLIKRQRLLALREALSRSGDERTIATLAMDCGFSSGAHAGRSFRAAFGDAPGRYRAARRARSLDTGESGAIRPAAWADDAVPAGVTGGAPGVADAAGLADGAGLV